MIGPGLSERDSLPLQPGLGLPGHQQGAWNRENRGFAPLWCAPGPLAIARGILHTVMMSDDPNKQDGDDKRDGADRQRIIREQVKEGQTSHWDLDLLSREELEALMKAREKKKETGEEKGEENRIPSSDGGQDREP